MFYLIKLLIKHLNKFNWKKNLNQNFKYDSYFNLSSLLYESS